MRYDEITIHMNEAFRFDEHWLSKNLDGLRKCLPFWHPLGFVNCTIYEALGLSVRLHLWPRGDRRPKEPAWPIHTHTYYLESVVLDGSVVDRQYERKFGNTFSEYVVKYARESSELIKSGSQTNIQVYSDRAYIRGDRYTIAPDVLHETKVPLTDEALTLVTCIGTLHGSPVVLGEGFVEPQTHSLEKFPAETFWRRVDQALEK